MCNVLTQAANGQRQLSSKGSSRPDQCLIFKLQQLRHGRPVCSTAPSTQNQIQGNAPVMPLQRFENKRLINICKFIVFLHQSLSGSLHNVAEDFSSSLSPSPSLSSSSCSSSHPDLSSTSLGLSPEPLTSASSSQTPLPVYNKQVADSCIIRVSMECVSNGNVYKSILVRTRTLSLYF